MSKYMMVLEDGETFSNLMGCHIIEVPDDWNDDFVPDVKVIKAVFTHAAMMIPKRNLESSYDAKTDKYRIGIKRTHGG